MAEARTDEIPKAFRRGKRWITADEVIQLGAEHVAPCRTGRAFGIVEEIQNSPSGKILRHVLIERERSAVLAQ